MLLERVSDSILSNTPACSKDRTKKIVQSILSKKGLLKIILLPQNASENTDKTYEHICPETYTILAIIGWSTWMIFDEHIDSYSKARKASALDFSTMRTLWDDALQNIPKKRLTAHKIKSMLIMMDHAERAGSNLPTRTSMILKSFGLSIPFLLYIDTLDIHPKISRACLRYFYHLIGARQLSDDALDWQEDMKRGQRTLVTRWLEEAVGKDRPLREYRKAFDAAVSPRVARTILDHSKKSIRWARKMTCFRSTGFLEELPRFYEDMATKILDEYKEKDKNALRVSAR